MNIYIYNIYPACVHHVHHIHDCIDLALGYSLGRGSDFLLSIFGENIFYSVWYFACSFQNIIKPKQVS